MDQGVSRRELMKVGLAAGALSALGCRAATVAPASDDPIGVLRERLEELAPESVTTLTYIRKKAPPEQVELRLGRRPPRFNGQDADPAWFEAPLVDPALEELIQRVVALDDGAARYADTLERNRKRFSKTDVFRMRQTVQVHMNLAANEGMARALTNSLAIDPLAATRILSGIGLHHAPPPHWHMQSDRWPEPFDLSRAGLSSASLETLVDTLERVLEGAADGILLSSSLTDEEGAWLLEHVEGLTSSLSEGPYLHYDEDLGRERDNRRIVKLLTKCSASGIELGASQLMSDVRRIVPHLIRAARDEAANRKDAKDRGRGLLLGRDTDVGRIEIWGAGDQRHTKRCAFRMDIGGNDDYLDVGGRADFLHPISLHYDVAGDDIYGATSSGCQGAAIGGVGVLVDMAGDDQYVARHWSQGAAIGGFGLLEDRGGNDVYRCLDLCQGVGLAGAGVLSDRAGNDHYTGELYAQGVGMAGAVGALVDHAGNDRYACTGRNQSGYGEDGLFEGWGQGSAFGFRHVTSGGIAVLYDRKGDDVYEAGNFSQGGG